MKKLLVILLLLVFSLPIFSNPKVALVLSGGGAKGCAHVPIIKELERRGIYPDLIVGTSMGGLVGGLYAAGYSGVELEQYILESDIADAIRSLSKPNDMERERPYSIFASNVYSFSNQNSLLDDRRVNEMIHKAIYKVESFKDLSIPFYAIAMDAKNGNEVVLSSGSLFEAMRSTMSIPVVFAPFQLSSKEFVSDGGIVMNLGASKAKDLGADIVIAVDVVEDNIENSDVTTIMGAINQFIAVSSQINAHREYDNVDYLILPELSAFPFMDFGQAEAIMQKGEEFVRNNQKLFDEIEQRVGKSDVRIEPYSEKEKKTVLSVNVPDELKEYSNLFDSYIGKEYDEIMVSSLSQILYSIKRWKNLGQLTYTFLDGTIYLNMAEGSNSNMSLDIGLVDGPILSLSARYEKIIAALSFGQNIASKVGYEFTPSVSLSVKGSYGCLSAASTWYLKDRILTTDISAGTEVSFKKRIYREKYIYLGASLDYYKLGRARNRVGESRIWDDEEFIVPSAFVSGKLEKSLSFANLYGQYELRLGYRDKLLYSFRGDSLLSLSLGHRNSVNISFSLFSSRFPYELSSSYFSDDFGILNRDYISMKLLYERVIAGESGPRFSVGPFISKGEEDRSFDFADEKGGSAFKYLEKVRFGLCSEIGYRASFGYYAIKLAISQDGLVSLRLTFR